MANSTGFNNAINLDSSNGSDSGKSFSTRYNDPSKWSAERRQQQDNAAKTKALFSTTISCK